VPAAWAQPSRVVSYAVVVHLTNLRPVHRALIMLSLWSSGPANGDSVPGIPTPLILIYVPCLPWDRRTTLARPFTDTPKTWAARGCAWLQISLLRTRRCSAVTSLYPTPRLPSRRSCKLDGPVRAVRPWVPMSPGYSSFSSG